MFYDAERYIGVNENSPLYEYNNGLGIGAIGIPGIYSKSEPFLHNGPGTAVFFARNANVTFNAPTSNPVAADSVHWVKCCENFRPDDVFRTAQNSEIVNQDTLSNLVYYPNPIKAGAELNIISGQSQAEPMIIKLSLYNILGQIVSHQTVIQNTDYFKYSIPENLPAGIYVLKVQYSGYTKTIRLTINN